MTKRSKSASVRVSLMSSQGITQNLPPCSRVKWTPDLRQPLKIDQRSERGEDEVQAVQQRLHGACGARGPSIKTADELVL